jgi:hypothetical protein
MAGLVPAIHVLVAKSVKGVDARHKAGHEEGEPRYSARFAAFSNFFSTRSRFNLER